MWELDHKEAECQRTDVFELWYWRRHLRIPLDSKIKPVNTEGNQPWLFIRRNDAEAPILWPHNGKSQLIGKRSWCWERLKAGGEGGNRGWDGWMASQTEWTWVWASSGWWWRTGKPGVLQFMGLQTVGHNWATEQQEHKYILGQTLWSWCFCSREGWTVVIL